MRWLLALAAAPVLLAGYDPGPVVTGRIDPLTIADDDFARHRDSATWSGLAVSQVDFREERATWRLFRIVNAAHPRGPLWVVPHDNEDAGFEAALVAVRRYGGTLVAVDSGDERADGHRRNAAVAEGPPIDPNRNFHDGLPRYPAQVLASVARGDSWPIIALHTNAPGYDPTGSLCPAEGDTGGTGIISIRYCDSVLRPRPSVSRVYPFDDDDSVAFATYRATDPREAAFCAREMIAADFNIVFERVVGSDGSLSNYAVLHGLAYLNFETRDRGRDAAALAAARDRLMRMIDGAMATCAAPAQRPTASPPLRFR